MTRKYLNFVELILSSAVSGYDSISAFASLVAIPVGITNCAVEKKNCANNAGITKYNSIIKKRRKGIVN